MLRATIRTEASGPMSAGDAGHGVAVREFTGYVPSGSNVIVVQPSDVIGATL